MLINDFLTYIQYCIGFYFGFMVKVEQDGRYMDCANHISFDLNEEYRFITTYVNKDCILKLG